jgi:predicted alpha-1,6-mannanase (GH76 family)
MNAFLVSFWDPETKYFFANSDHVISPDHAHGPQNGLYSDFWWEAQLWELVMDACEYAAFPECIGLIPDVYDGFVTRHPTWTNQFNDDLGWWALAGVRASRLTGDGRYRDNAITLFDSIWQFHDLEYGGGIWWKRDANPPQKNVATNSPAVMTAAQLAEATGDARYLAQAQALFEWVTDTFFDDGHVHDHLDEHGTLVHWDFTYNFGTYIGAALALYRATNEPSYLSAAVGAADTALARLVEQNGIIRYEGIGDAGGFRTIFCRYLCELGSIQGLERFKVFLRTNASRAWSNRRQSDDLCGPDWNTPAPMGPLQSMSAAAGTAIVLYAVHAGGTS